MRCELTDFEWAAITSFLPNKPRGIPRVDDNKEPLINTATLIARPPF
jgi:hypothetical protein